MRTHLQERTLSFEKDVNIFHTNTMHCVQKTKTTSENVLFGFFFFLINEMQI